MTERIKEPWGGRTPFRPGEEWPVRVDQFLKEGVSEGDVDRWVQTASILHSNGDALDVAVKGGHIVGVRGRGVDRVNKGRVDPKDLFGWQANNSDDRLKRPLVRENGELVETSWDEAMSRIVERSKELLEEKGPLAFGFYTTGQLFLEEYYTLGVMGKAGLGTPHMDGNTRLCTATAAEALTNQKRGVRRRPCAETGRSPCPRYSSLYALARRGVHGEREREQGSRDMLREFS
jgi:ferredoxin-nitrate reductase